MNSIDQHLTLMLNGSQSVYLDQLALTATQTATWLPLALVLLYVLVRHNNLVTLAWTILAIALAILLADQVASSIFKPLVARYRPAQNPAFMYTVDVINGYRGGLYGFFSSHAANTFAVATFVSLLIRNRILTVWLYSWSLVNCWSRVYLGVHYIGDLLTGAAWGLFVGWAVYALWKKYAHHTMLWTQCQQRRNTDCSPTSGTLTASGFSMSSVHLLIIALALTYLYISLRALIA